jgi:2-polyprenyl-3-methyl-5-hydroxy-6-metoxy-1,4-benzoquinol methylase
MLMLDYFFPNLQRRNTSHKEMLELPDLDLNLTRRTIRQFKLINRLFSGSSRLMRRYFFSVMEKHPDRAYTLLDIGAGGCDIAIAAVREARRRGLQLAITALDNDPRTLAVAYQATRDYPEIRLVEGNALQLSRLGAFDFIFSNHLLHHLGWDEIKILLDQITVQTRLVFVMSDLKRSHWAYLGFTLFSPLLTPRSFHFHDGRLSIRRGFLPGELRDFLRREGPGREIQVVETYPSRVVLVYRSGIARGEGSAAG